MNAAHVHLIVNHVSLFALTIGVFVLAASMKRKSSDLRILAVVLFVIGGAFGFIAHQSGDQAWDLLKELSPELKPFVHEHDEAADWALRTSILVAVVALATEWAHCKKEKWFKPLQWILLILAIQSSTVFMRTAYLGGLIRHTEIRSDGQAK